MFGLVLDLLAKVVEHHDVGVHVEEVVGVGRVVFRGPHLRLRAAVREHMVAVLRLVVHAVEASHLVDREDFFFWLFFSFQFVFCCLHTGGWGVCWVRTYFRKTCKALCCCGLTVASNSGRKMFCSILA